MIVVTGTKRSGTSMWMQILQAGGIEPIGEQFPLDWGDRLRDLNPQGFFESRLRSGINFTSNPDPETGFYLAPQECEQKAVKVFIPGVLCTDLAFLGRVIATMRDWRGYVRSRARLEAVDMSAEVPEDFRFAARYNLPAHLEWWVENYALLRDAMMRQYPFTLFTYESIIAGEPDLIEPTFEWIGFGDGAAARAAVKPSHETDEPIEVDIDPELAATFDELYRRVHEGEPLDDAFIDRMDDTHEALLPQIAQHVHESYAAVTRLQRKADGTESLNLRSAATTPDDASPQRS